MYVFMPQMPSSLMQEAGSILAHEANAEPIEDIFVSDSGVSFCSPLHRKKLRRRKTSPSRALRHVQQVPEPQWSARVIRIFDRLL